MVIRKLLKLVLLAVVVASLVLIGGDPASAQKPTPMSRAEMAKQIKEKQAKRITNEQRLAAAERAKKGITAPGKKAPAVKVPTPGGTPNYFGPESNWANSPLPTVDPLSGAISGGIRKFVDKLPLLGAGGANGLVTPGGDPLGQYMTVAVPDIVTYPGSDYYEIELHEFTEKMHSDLNPTTLRGYVQVNNGTDTTACGGTGQPACTVANNTIAPAPIHYLGPLIVSNSGRPVRVKFTNKLAIGAGGNLFLPVDTTEMGAGMGPLGMNVTPGYDMNYKQNRATLHLHGGRTPWISDGTPHQWTTPAGEQTDYPKGVSVQNVPDMPDPGPGAITFFYSNQQSARLMFYHDHAFGITRLNVYAGEAAGYLVRDATENDLVARGIIPGAVAGDEIPLVIQDKTFIDTTTVLTNDPTWPFPLDATKSNLWYPHVWMPNQNPNDPEGVNYLGRWDYGPWFWPPWPTTNAPLVDPVTGAVTPNVPNLSMTMEAYHDTPVVNGTVYPYLDVQPKAYRFRILNAANDRFWNLQLYQASTVVGTLKLTGGGSGYTDAPMVTITRAAGDTTGKGATARATVDTTPGSPTLGQVTAVALVTVGSAYTLPPTVTIAPPVAGTAATATASLSTNPTEVGMVPAVQGTDNFPSAWTAQVTGQPGDILDGRTGGVPDPATIGPSMIQIGNEGGFLPAPVVWTNIPLGWDRDPKSITITNVKEHNLYLGPAERADVVIDFSQFAGKTIILYNDACAACPATDSRLDYYTGQQDQSDIGGTKSTLPGYGPNIRTLMQIRVAAGTGTPFNLTALQNEFTSTASTQGVFAKSQDPIIVPQVGYNSAYNATFPNDKTAYARIQDTSITFTPINATAPVTVNFQPKAIQELFENEYGRMSAYLGVELPFTNGMNQTTIDYGYHDPATEIIDDTSNIQATPIGATGDGTQIWKITHNGVDTHPIHFHLFDVQVLNRVGWDGTIRPPEPNELGWKETVRMNPLEDAIVALRASSPKVPFGVPDSVRPLDPTMPIGSTAGFRNIDPATGNPITVINTIVNFGWEYVWHCHILSHEEMDMMRAMVFNVARQLPTAPVVTAAPRAAKVQPKLKTTGIKPKAPAAILPVVLTWTDGTPWDYTTNTPATTLGNPANEVGFRIQRASIGTNGKPGTYSTIGSVIANQTTYTDNTADSAVSYSYRVIAYNAAGNSVSNALSVLAPPAAPTNLTAVQSGAQVNLSFTDNATTESNFVVESSTDNGVTFNPIATLPARNGTGNVTYADTTVVIGTTYIYRVKAVNSGGSSAYATSAPVTVVGIPTAPSGLTATAVRISTTNTDRVTLTWTDNSNNEVTWTVQRALNATFTSSLVTSTITSTTGSQTGVQVTGQQTVDRGTPGVTRYYYRIRAVNAAGNSGWSNIVSVVTQ